MGALLRSAGAVDGAPISARYYSFALPQTNHSLPKVLESGVFDPLLTLRADEAFTRYHETRRWSEETIRTKHIGAPYFNWV